MFIQHKKISASGIKFFIQENNKEIGRIYLYILKNDLHKAPFGFLEDVFVAEKFRGRGLGRQLIQEVIKVARQKRCYKLLATSRRSKKKLHGWYRQFGFKKWGWEFRVDF